MTEPNLASPLHSPCYRYPTPCYQAKIPLLEAREFGCNVLIEKVFCPASGSGIDFSPCYPLLTGEPARNEVRT
jgi:hypothetical protein